MYPEKVFAYVSNVLPLSSFVFFADMKNKGDYCDIVLKFGKMSISAHSIIIAAAIPYLRETLQDRGTQMEIHIPQIDNIKPSAIQSMIDFAYHCKLKTDAENVMDLLSAASLFQMDEVRNACCSFLAKNLHPENAINVRDAASRLGCPDLVESTDKYVAENFAEVSQTEEFLKCPFSLLKGLIRRDDIHVKCEEEVYESVMKWVDHKPSERTTHLPELIANVRLALLELWYLRLHVAENQLILDSPPIRKWINEVTNYHVLPGKVSLSPSFNTKHRCYKNTVNAATEKNEQTGTYCRTASDDFEQSGAYHRSDNEDFQQREIFYSARGKNEESSGIYACSRIEDEQSKETFCKEQRQSCENDNGFASEQNVQDGINCSELHLCSEDREANGIYAIHSQLSFTLQRFDNNANTWLVKKRESFNINTASVVGLNDEICFMDCENMCYYSPQKNKLNFTQRYTQGRAFVAVGDQLYIFGGSNGQVVFNTAKCFDSEEEEWYDLKCMEECREFAGCVALEGHVYVLGGNDLDEVHMTVERYNIHSAEWTFAEPMLLGRSRHGSAALNGKIYVCGGIVSLAEQECNCKAEVYDPVDDTWTLISPLTCVRVDFYLVSYAGKLYALGGNNENNDYVNDVEVYNPRTENWSLERPMASELQITGAAVVQNLPV